MDTPLTPGKKYKLGPNGEFIDTDASAPTVNEDDLPPDMRANAASAKIDKMVEAVDKISKIIDSKQGAAEPDLPKMELSDQDRMKFLKAVISNQPYKKSYKVFGGKITFTFKTLSTSELDAVSEALAIQSTRVPYTSVLAMAGAHMRFAMATALCDIEYDTDDGIKKTVFKCIGQMYGDDPRKDTFYVRNSAGDLEKKESLLTPSPGQKVLWGAADKFADISVPLYNVIFEKYQNFDAEVNQLTRESADPDFFQSGVGGL